MKGVCVTAVNSDGDQVAGMNEETAQSGFAFVYMHAHVHAQKTLSCA